MANYYFSQSTGNDANPGTEALPFQTMTKLAALTLLGGDTCYLKAGDTWTDKELRIGDQDDGNNTPITVTRYGTGADPIIDRQGAALSVGIYVYNSAYVIIENIHVKNTALHGIWHVGTALAGAGDTRGLLLRNCTTENVSTSSANAYDHIHIDTGITSYSGTGTERLIQGCRVIGDGGERDGISLNGPLSWTVEWCRVTGCNATGAGQGDGITTHETVDGHIIRFNTCDGNADGIHCANNSPNIKSQIYSNWCLNNLQSGINLHITDSENMGLWEVRNNVVSVPDLASVTGGIVFGGVDPDGNTATLAVLNNTIEVLRTAKPALFFRSFNDATPAGAITLKNNVVTGVAGVVMVRVDHPHATGGFTTWTAGTNFYHLNAAASFNWDGTTSNFSSWQTNSGGDTDSQAGTDPLLRGSLASNPRFARLKRASTVQALGEDLSVTFTDDFTGGKRTSWSAGAIRYKKLLNRKLSWRPN